MKLDKWRNKPEKGDRVRIVNLDGYNGINSYAPAGVEIGDIVTIKRRLDKPNAGRDMEYRDFKIYDVKVVYDNDDYCFMLDENLEVIK